MSCLRDWFLILSLTIQATAYKAFHLKSEQHLQGILCKWAIKPISQDFAKDYQSCHSSV